LHDLAQELAAGGIRQRRALTAIDPITDVAEQVSLHVPSFVLDHGQEPHELKHGPSDSAEAIVVRTLERYAIARGFARSLSRDLLVVGSMAYGSFFSLRERSDLDLLYVVDDIPGAVEEVTAHLGLAPTVKVQARSALGSIGDANAQLSGIVISTFRDDGRKLFDLRIFEYRSLLAYFEQIVQEFDAQNEGVIGPVAELRTANDLKDNMEDLSGYGDRRPSLMIGAPLVQTAGLFLSNNYFGRWKHSRFYLGPFGNVVLPRVTSLDAPSAESQALFDAIRSVQQDLLAAVRDLSGRADVVTMLYRLNRIRPDLRALYVRQ